MIGPAMLASPCAIDRAADLAKESAILTDTIAFIDANVDDLPLLLDGIQPEIEAIVLDPNQDGVAQITAALQSRLPVRHLHIVAHGAPGCLFLGNTCLSFSTLDRYASHLQSWDAVTLHLYACNVAAGDAGAEFLQKLHCLTAANIAAAAEVVGNPERGGRWQLEVHWGIPTPDFVFTAPVVQHYRGVFALSFGPATSVNVGPGTNPFSVAIGDFNGDGKADLVTANNKRDTLSVVLGNGRGGFSSASTFVVGFNPNSVKTGDLNGDGKADLVATGPTGLSVLLGDGTGNFGPVRKFAVIGSLQAIGDWNGDGKIDVVATNNVGLLVGLGDGAGNFGTATVISTGTEFNRPVG